MRRTISSLSSAANASSRKFPCWASHASAAHPRPSSGDSHSGCSGTLELELGGSGTGSVEATGSSPLAPMCSRALSIDAHHAQHAASAKKPRNFVKNTANVSAAWHASHSATTGILTHHDQGNSRVSSMHTSAVAAAVAERAEATAFTNELPENLANGHMERDTNGHHQRLQLVQEAVAVYDEMRDALRQTTTTNNQAALRSIMEPEFLETSKGRLAYQRVHSKDLAGEKPSPGVIFCGGMLSSMNGRKATTLEMHARQRGHPFIRFDYSGHGSSDGVFEDTMLGDWYEDTLEIIDRVASPACQHVLVGSSIGAWIALKAAASRRESVQGVVLLAPAVDITEVWWDGLSPDDRADAKRSGLVPLKNDMPEQRHVRLSFFEEASDHCILDVAQRDQQVRCPVRIFHGTNDDVVPPAMAGEIASWLESKDVKVSLVKGGDHRLSRPEDLQAMMLAVEELLAYNAK